MDKKYRIKWYNWQGILEQDDIVEVESLEQAEMAGKYECEQQGFDHYELELVDGNL